METEIRFPGIFWDKKSAGLENTAGGQGVVNLGTGGRFDLSIVLTALRKEGKYEKEEGLTDIMSETYLGIQEVPEKSQNMIVSYIIMAVTFLNCLVIKYTAFSEKLSLPACK